MNTYHDEDELCRHIDTLRKEVAALKPAALVAPTLLDALRLMVNTFSRCSAPAQGGSDPFTYIYAEQFGVAQAAIRDAEAALNPQPHSTMTPQDQPDTPLNVTMLDGSAPRPPVVHLDNASQPITMLEEEHEHALIGLAVAPNAPPRFVYSLSRLLTAQLFACPQANEQQATRFIWQMVERLQAQHGDRAPIFVDDAAMRARDESRIIDPNAPQPKQIIVP